MKRLTTLHRWCNLLVIAVLLLGLLPPFQNLGSPAFEPRVAHAQEVEPTPTAEATGAPEKPDIEPSPTGTPTGDVPLQPTQTTTPAPRSPTPTPTGAVVTASPTPHNRTLQNQLPVRRAVRAACTGTDGEALP